MSGWYYADRNREQHGPVSSDELVTHFRFGRVALDSLVWREGMAQWLPLRDVADELGLNPAPVDVGSTPPPVPQAPSASAPHERLGQPSVAPATKPGMSGGKIALIVAAVLLVPCLGIGAILAAISLPAYNDYTLRSKVSQAIAESEPLKLQVEAIRTGEGRCPGNDEDGIGAPESYAGTYVTRVVVGEFDDGTCGFELEFGNTGNAAIDGRKLWRDMGSDHDAWNCSSEIDNKWLPLDCRD
ncbi:GYF domain-containing protein [Pseudoxanthomonas sp.]|jgi:Tfp pilus assembly protein, major pilin PilA|uniref:GYF domain-containing protein n=1 Tax=Pseudoxanthomonas sp. TaxID=1871049 RepID=UPI002FE1EA83